MTLAEMKRISRQKYNEKNKNTDVDLSLLKNGNDGSDHTQEWESEVITVEKTKEEIMQEREAAAEVKEYNKYHSENEEP